MEQQIQISMLGRFAILVDGVDLVAQLSKSKKGLCLLQYLILQEGMPVPNQQLYEVLWPSEASSNPESALKTLISRLRSILVLGGHIVPLLRHHTVPLPFRRRAGRRQAAVHLRADRDQGMPPQQR